MIDPLSAIGAGAGLLGGLFGLGDKSKKRGDYDKWQKQRNTVNLANYSNWRNNYQNNTKPFLEGLLSVDGLDLKLPDAGPRRLAAPAAPYSLTEGGSTAQGDLADLFGRSAFGLLSSLDGGGGGGAEAQVDALGAGGGGTWSLENLDW